MNKKNLPIAALAAMLAIAPAQADNLGSASGGQAGNQSGMAGALCLTSPVALSNGQQAGLLIDCTTHALITEGVSGGVPIAVTTTPGPRTIVTLDVKTVTTGGTAVTAIAAGHRTAGGFLQNPVGATTNLCINEIGTASGTTSSGDTTCIQPGQSYTVAPAATGVSVISSDSSHPFSGYGLN